MMIALVLGLYIAAIALGARYANSHNLSDQTRVRICLAFAALSLAAFVFAGVTDTKWPVAVWYIISGLLVGVSIGDHLRGNRERQLEAALVPVRLPSRRK